MSTEEDGHTLTRKQLRGLRLTGSTPVVSSEDAAAAQAAQAETPSDRSAETDSVESHAAERAAAEPGAAVQASSAASSAPLTRRAARAKERGRTDSGPVDSIAPQSAAEEPVAAQPVAEPVVAALRSGCHVFCEKIMAGTRAEGRRMTQAAAEAGRVLGVNYNYRHFGVFRRLRQMLDDGSLGEAMALVATVNRFCWHHVLDLSRFLLGQEIAMRGLVTDDPKQAVDFWPDDTELLYIPRKLATGSIEFAGGAVASITSSGHQPFAFSLIDLRLVGTKGTVDVRRITVGDLVGRVETSSNVNWPGPLDGPRTLDDSFVTSLHAFLDALAAGRAVPTDGADGLAVMELEHAAVRSGRSGRRVALAEL